MNIVSLLEDAADYVWRVFVRVDFIAGGVLAVGSFFIADIVGLGNYRGHVVAFVAIASYAIASFAVYREERTQRADRERQLRIDARIIRFSANVPDPGPDKAGFKVTVLCEVWTSIDVTTSDVGLNVIWGYREHWWELWKKDRVYMEGLPPVPEDSTQFRKSIRAIDPQPIKWQFDFEYLTERVAEDDPHWFLELAIKTGMPPDTHRVPISLEDSIGPRPMNPPL